MFAILLMLLVILSTFSVMFYSPVSTGTYAAAPALLIPSSGVAVRGNVYQWHIVNETSGYWDSAGGINVRIFATDELVSEIVATNVRGTFYGNRTYESGQVLTLTIKDQRFRAFIPYFARGMVSLGDFYLDT
jgi:hypothetical protein